MSADFIGRVEPPAVTGEDLLVAYRGRTVVDVPHIELPAGQTYALLGASGAGKSTLMRVLGLLERPTRGTVLHDGAVVRPGDLAARRRIAAVFQKPYLLRGDVGENVGYGLRLRGVNGAERARRVAAGLDRVGMAGWERRSALTLSGGEQQRVALARALVLEPSLLLLDEPLSYLDPLLKRTLSAEFADILAGQHITALYVTHDQDEAAVVADRIGIMRDGRMIAEGSFDGVLGLPADDWIAEFAGMERALRGTVSAVEDGLLSIDVEGVTVRAAGSLPVGTQVLLAVRPEDVTLVESGVDLPHMSARNQVHMHVQELRRLGSTVRVVLERGGLRLAASLSRSAAADLRPDIGTEFVAAFKATAVHVAPASAIELACAEPSTVAEEAVR